jgi:predicted O-methyltransferase YrrM
MVGHTRVENRPYYQHQTADRRNPKFKGRFLPAIKKCQEPSGGESQMVRKKTLLERAYAVGMLQVRSEVSELYDWLAARKLTDVLEIGTDGGGLLYLLLHMTAGRAVSVDKECGQYGTGIDFAWRNAAFDQAFPQRIQWISGDSATEEVRRKVEGEFDLIVIDGDHRQAFMDFSHYRAHLRPGGWVLFHDIKDTPQHRAQGVTVAGDWKKARELGKECLEFCDESVGWGGIGLLQL